MGRQQRDNHKRYRRMRKTPHRAWYTAPGLNVAVAPVGRMIRFTAPAWLKEGDAA